MLLLAALIAADFHLTFARGGCMGACPIYRMTIDAQGMVTFNGERYTSVVGERKRTMTRDEMEKLARAVDDVHFFDLTDHQSGETQCREVWTDAPSASITVHRNGRDHTVQHYLGCRGFRGEDALIAFEKRIDQLAGVTPWIKTDARLESRRIWVNHFGDACDNGVDCEAAAAKLERESLLLMENGANVVRIDRDGSALLTTQQLRFVREVRATLSPDRLRELTARVAKIPKPYGIPVIEKPPADLQPLADDRTWTKDARTFRVELMPSVPLQGTIEPWPAEDLVPFAELTTRTFTRDEWDAIAKRLEYHDRKGFADFRMLEGNTMLRLIAIR